MRRSVLALVMVLVALPSAVSQSCLGGIISVNPGNVGDQITTLTEIPFSDLNGITSGGLPLDLTILFDDMKFLESSGDVIYRVEITYSGGIDLSSPVAQPSYDEWYLLDERGHEIPLTQPGLSKAASLGSIGWQKLGMVVDTGYIPGVGSQPFYGLHYLWETPQASPTVNITGARLVVELKWTPKTGQPDKVYNPVWR